MTHATEPGLLQHLALLLFVATGVSFVFRWARLPAVLGYLVTGVVMGPQGFELIEDPQIINQMAQIGILFLLFVTGLELSVSHLRHLRWIAPIAGTLQVALSTLIVALLVYCLGMPLQLALLVGLILSLSSTALVLKHMEDLDELETFHGRVILGILVIQDLSTVLMMTLVPTLSRPLEGEWWTTVLWVVLKALLALLLAGWVSFQLVPRLLDTLAATRSREVFILSVTCIGIGMSVLTGSLGLSYEAGAFIAGLALSSSMYSEQAIADSKPFREVFSTLFFVSVGLLVDLNYLWTHVGVVLLGTTVLVLAKGMAAFWAVRLAKQSVKTAMWSALTLFQVGEFSFILLRRVLEQSEAVPQWRLVLDHWAPLLTNTIVLSMFITPLVILAIPKILYRTGMTIPPVDTAPPKPRDLPETMRDHVIVAGYGPVAKQLTQALAVYKVPYVVVEMNPATIKTLQDRQIPCCFGDVGNPDILRASGIESARLFALTFPDVRTAQVALQLAKQMNPNVWCLVRGRYRSQMDRLLALGADEVVYEEYEISEAFLYSVFDSLGYPVPLIEGVLKRYRETDRQGRGQATRAMEASYGQLSLMSETTLGWIEIPDDSPLLAKTLAQAKIRQETGVNVLAIIDFEGNETSNPPPEYTIQPLDILVAMGRSEQLAQLEEMLQSPRS